MNPRALAVAGIAPLFTVLILGTVITASSAESSSSDAVPIEGDGLFRRSVADSHSPEMPGSEAEPCAEVAENSASKAPDRSRSGVTECESEAPHASGGTSLVLDGGFEQGSPNPVWSEISTTFGTPLCTPSCGFGGGSGPHSGSWWAWFGGVNGTAEYGAVDQDITIPAGTSTLSFWLEIPNASGSGGDFVAAWIDSDLVFFLTDLQASPYSNYSQVVIDVSAYGDCMSHNLQFNSQTLGAGITNFFIDDVDLEVVDPATFCDVPFFHWAWTFIEAIFDGGISAGFPDGTFRPDNPATRAEMAVFLNKGIHGSTYTPPTPDGSHPFNDIVGHWAEAWIEQLYDQGLTSGFPDSSYRPENRVTRAEMAVFLLKALYGNAYTPPSPVSGSFSDVAGHWAEAWIEQLKVEGITFGYPDGTFRPDNQVTRAEMAVFLVNAFSLPLP